MEKVKGISQSISPTDLNTYLELFSFFDKDDSGFIPISSVPMYLQGLGYCPSKTQLLKILQDFGSPTKNSVSFRQILQFISKSPKDQQIENKLMQVFASLTRNTQSGKNQLIQINSLKNMLQKQGQPLNQSQIMELIQFINANDLKVNQQEFNYRNFCKILAYSQMDN